MLSKTDRPIYCSVPLEFLQPWDMEGSLEQIVSLGLGNMTLLNIAFHVGNSDEERRRWKEAFPALAERIDTTPRFETLPQHGMPVVMPLPLEFYLDQLRRCRELGLMVMCYLSKRNEMSPEEFAQCTAAGEGVVLADGVFMESLSKMANAYSLEKLAVLSPSAFLHGAESRRAFALPDSYAELNLQLMHDWLLAPFRQEIAGLKAMGAQNLMAIEASVQIHLAMEAGCNLPILELVPHDPLGGLAAVRGAAKAYGAPFWGVHTALGYYQSPTNEWTAERLQIAYNLFYAAGCSLFSEPNIAFHNVGLCSAFFSQKGSPPVRWGEEEIRPFDHPICVRGREVLADHYRFTQFHRRPESGPRVKMGFVMGHLDGYAGHEQDYVWCVDDPAFAAGAAEATWHHFERMFNFEHWYTPPRKYYWQADPAKPLIYGTPPCGQLDIVPLAAPLEVLQTYSCLVFLGWNTMTREHYDKLKAYVHSGGRLLMSVPQLSTQLRRDEELQLIDGGDFSELFGARVIGKGREVEEILLTAQSEHPAYVLPVGTLYLEGAPLAKVKLNGAHVLAQPRGGDEAVLIENRYGDGVAWLLTTWEYPGHRLDAFNTDLLRTIADGEQAEIAVLGAMVDYALYDSEASDGKTLTTVYLANKNIYGQPQYPRVIVNSNPVPVRVGGYEMRIVWIYDNELLISPYNRFVQVADVMSVSDGYRITLNAESGEHRIQLARLGGGIDSVEVDGERVVVVNDDEGAGSFHCRLGERSVIRLYACS